MKIAVITDIHGNFPALKAALQAIDREGVSHIYCLGDMIGIGPDTNQVLAELFSLPNVSMITGNHDEGVLTLIHGEAYPASHSDVRRHHEWIADRLDPVYITKLDQLPRMIQIVLEGHRVLFTHYHIDRDKREAPFCDDPFSPIVQPTLGNLERLFGDGTEELICFGHHHPTQFLKGKRTIYLNPGSLGCCSDPVARYAIIRLSRSAIDIRLNSVPYDRSDFLAAYEKLKVPDRAFILKTFHGQ